MKLTIFLLSAIFALTYALPPPLHDDGGKVHIPDKCEDVLAVKVCDNLEAMAIRLKLKAEDVTRAVVAAAKQGKTSSVEIYNAAKDFLMNEVLTKKCEDFTTADNCERLRKVAGVLKINAAKLESFVIKAVAEGAVQAKDVYAIIKEYYKAEIATKKCEDFLSASQCAQLRTIASKLKVNFDDLEDAIKDAYLETLGDAKQMVDKVIATLKDYALNTKCEDLLNPALCSALRKYAQMTKVGLPVLMEKAVDLLVKGYDVGKGLLSGVYKLVDSFYDCEDVFDKSSCERLFKMASFLGMAHGKVEDFLKKYIPIAVETGKDIVNDFPSLMKELGKYLKEQWCKATPFCFNADDAVLDSAMFSVDDPIFDFDAIKQQIKQFIEQKYQQVNAQIKEKIFAIIDKATTVSQLIQDAVTEMIFVGGKAADTVKAILKDMIVNIKSILDPASSGASDEVAYIANDYLDAIKQKLTKYINESYSFLEQEIKQKALDVINKAQSIVDLIAKAAKEILDATEDAAVQIKAIFMDLILNVQKELGFTDNGAMYDLSFEDLRQKLTDFINNNYPQMKAKAKQVVLDVIAQARSSYDLMFKLAKEIYNANADDLKQILGDVVKYVKDQFQ